MSLWGVWLLLTLVLFVPFYILFKGLDIYKKHKQAKTPTLEQMTGMTHTDLRRLYEDNDN